MLKDTFPSNVKLGSLQLEFDLEEDLHINDTDLSEEFIRQAVIFAKYSTAYEIALKIANNREAELDRLCAHLNHEGRMEAKTAGIKMTDSMAEGFVKGHSKYIEKMMELNEAQELAGLLKQARDAMIQKKDMLIQLGYSQRQERAADISMKAEYLKDS